MTATRTQAELQEMQNTLEAEMFGNGILRFEKNNERAIEEGAASGTAWYRRLTRQFIEPTCEALDAYFEYYAKRAGRPSMALAYLQMLPTNVSAFVAIRLIFDSLHTEGMSIQNLAEKIGKRIEDQVRFTRIDESSPKYMEAIKKGLSQSKTKSYRHSRAVMVDAEKRMRENKNPDYVCDIDEWEPWSKEARVHTGSCLIDIIMWNILYKGEAIIQSEKVYTGTGPTDYILCITPTASILGWIDEYKEEVGQLAPCYSPCVVPPKDWVTATKGGYHTKEVQSTLPLVKTDNRKHLRRLTRSQMPKVYQAVNTLQRVGWATEKRVVDVLNAVLEDDLQLGVPSKEPIRPQPAPVPMHLRHLKGKELLAVLSEEEKIKFAEWKADTAAIYDNEKERKSNYLSAGRVAGQARKYSEFDAFYFVYTLDFRSRVYCQSSLLSPQGDDLQKGMLRFSEGMKLGLQGRYWLAVQGANVYGNDKVDFPERVQFIEEMEEEIRDIAADPLVFNSWTKADKPWQFLNWCFEWNDLLEHEDEGGKAEEFVSHIPVAMDGSCSGTQHYSAMLRDPIGGAAVNLVPNEVPQDIYREVANVTMRLLKEIFTLAAEPEAIISMAASWFDFGINRDITKKSVMTITYGSTQTTCRASIKEYLKKRIGKEKEAARADGRDVKPVHPFCEDKNNPTNVLQAEKLLAKVMWQAIGEVVIAARQAMKYIKSVTRVVAKENMPLEWETQAGFIVEQVIYKMDKRRIKTQLMGATTFTLNEPTNEIDVSKMCSSCAPNFIHSCDASHLILSVCAFADNGITSIAVIHDSFGTHAGNTETLRRLLLEAFVEMYKRENWLELFKLYCEGRILKEISIVTPEYLGLDLDVILDSEYCFG